MRYRVELSLSPAAAEEHLAALLAAAAEFVTPPLRTAWPQAGEFAQIRAGSWGLTLDPFAWATRGTPLLLGLLALERYAGHEVWQTLGPLAEQASYRLLVEAAGVWHVGHQVG